MTIISPPMALGLAVHEIIESLSVIQVKERLNVSLVEKFENVWHKYQGKKGGFTSDAIEEEYKERGMKMLSHVQENPGPIKRKAVKVQAQGNLPFYWLSEEENIILCGKIDWIEFLEKDKSVNIIDFKTGKNTENESSLQLPIYLLLATNTQKWPVKQASYWYLAREEGLTRVTLPHTTEAFEKVFSVAKRIKLAKQLEHFTCQKSGCRNCLPYEEILKGAGEKVGISEYNQDVFIIPN